MSTHRITEQLEILAQIEADESLRKQALDRLVEYTYDELRRFIVRQMSRQPGRTHGTRFVHELFPALLKREQPFKNRNDFFGWAKWKLKVLQTDYFRAERRRGAWADELLLEKAIPHHPRIDADTRLDLERAISQLPHAEREFLMLMSEGQSVEAAAKRLNMTAQRATQLKRLCIAKLKVLLSDGSRR